MSRPDPSRERWQPLRLGLTDLFYYDHEEFTFRDGRLLLRGNNLAEALPTAAARLASTMEVGSFG